jgi:DNA-binding SARP family transcriptional activator
VLDFRVLGPLQVAANGTFLPLGGAKQRAVLGLLLVRANEVVSSDRLIDELWGDSPPESAANMLQGYVSHLRKTLEPGRGRGEHEVLVSRPPGYMLKIRPDQLDAARFERLTSEGRQLADSGDADAAAARFRGALALWRGPALADLAYEPFAKAEVDRLEELRLAALEDRIDADLTLGRHNHLVGELRELVDRHPLRERLRGQLMAALYRCGRQADALEAYREGRRALLEELGIEPGPGLRELEQAILRQDPALGATVPPPVPIATRIRRRWPLLVGAGVLAGTALAAVLAFGHSGRAKAIVVRPHSVAVIDPSTNTVAKDISVGGYPGPLAADGVFVYVCNIGDATVSRISPDKRKVYDTGSLSRAIDLVAVNRHLWAADGGTPGHTPAPPGTVLDLDLQTAQMRTIRVGPSVDGDEEQTTIAANAQGSEIWTGNKDSETVTQIKPATMVKIHGIAPGGLAVVASAVAGDTVWASDPSRNVVVRIDASAKRITQRIAIPGEPTRLAADAHAVWVTTRAHNGPGEWRPTRGTTPAVWRIDARTNEPVARIPLSVTPMRIALGAGSVWVTALRVVSSSGKSVDATVLRIDPARNRIVARISLHTPAVDGIVFSHGLVWVAVPQSQ